MHHVLRNLLWVQQHEEPVGAVTSPTDPPLEPETVQKALIRILKDRGLEPRASWVTVRLVVGTPEHLYTVIITYEPARAELAGVLRSHHASSAENNMTGFWVLTESDARNLCEGAPPDAL